MIGNMLNSELDESQKGDLKLLLEIDEICRKHQIQYFLSYGTLLGAIRHEGFIPWDNDVDITMDEENYNRFAEVCRRELDGTTRILCDSRSVRGFPKVYGKYYDLTCCRLSDKVNYWENVCGRGVDIFYHIDIPPGEADAQEFLDYFFAYDEYVNDVYRHYRAKTDRVMRFYEEAKARELQVGKEQVLREMEARIFNRHTEGAVYCIDASARYVSPDPIAKKAYYAHPVRVPFEGHMLPVPGDYLEMLRKFYGDDFNLFPKEPKITNEVAHNEFPYRESLDDFLHAVDKKELMRVQKEYKEAAVEEGRRATEIMVPFYQAYAVSIRNHIRQKIEKKHLDPASLTAAPTAENAAILEDLFREYYTRQLAESPLYWRSLFRIGGDLLYAALYHLLYNRHERKAVEKLFRLMAQNRYPLTEPLKSIQSVCDHIWLLKKHILLKNAEAAGDAARWCMQAPYVKDFPEVQELLLQYRYLTAGSEEDREALGRTVAEKLQAQPDNMYYRKISADLAFDAGNRDSAEIIYRQLQETANDGMLLLDIRHRLADSRALSDKQGGFAS